MKDKGYFIEYNDNLTHPSGHVNVCIPVKTSNTSAGTIRTDIRTEQAGNATHFAFSLSPDTTDTFLSELGIAFLLDKNIDRVQWIGQGLMPT